MVKKNATQKPARSKVQPEQYKPKPEESAAISKALERRRAASASRFKVEDNCVFIDHQDGNTGILLLENALGSANPDFVLGLIEQLTQASSGGGHVSESALNFMISVIKDIEPRDQMEAMLASQMAAVHMLTLKFVGPVDQAEGLPQQEMAIRTVMQLSRSFVTQMEALKRYRSRGDQNITVQHVSVSDGGQAIVGNVTQRPNETALDKAAPRVAALTHSKTAPMEKIVEPEREAVRRARKPSK